MDKIGDTLRSQMQEPPAIDSLCQLFNLTSFERSLLLLCAGAEMDSQLADACAQAQGHPQRTYVSFGLAMALLEDSHWDAITPSRPLRRFRMIELQAGSNLTSAPLRIDERILHYLAGENALDSRLQWLLRLSPFPEWMGEEHRGIAARAAQLLQSNEGYSPLIQLCGNDPQGQEDIAAFAAHELGRELFVVSAEDLPALGAELDQFALPVGARVADACGCAVDPGRAGRTVACRRASGGATAGPLFLAHARASPAGPQLRSL